MDFFKKFNIQIFIFTGIVLAVNTISKFFIYDELDNAEKFGVFVFAAMSVLQFWFAGEAVSDKERGLNF